ncbi:MAG: PEP-CTERM sorting domain-containing protein [Planctomycetales bacterium]|nr:PEP-CTERM sorting domain-containing protein [Planctomycetales bacterium]
MNTLHRWAWVVVFGLLTSRVEAIELVWSDQGGIHRFDTMGSAGAQQLFEAFDSRGVAFDAARGRLIWSDNLPLGAPLPGGVIRSGRLTGGAAEDLVNQLTFPADVAFDERRQRIIWTDLGDGAASSSIFASNADGSDARQRIRGDYLSEIQGVAIDQLHNKLYFSYVNPLIDSIFNGAIACADLKDLSNAEAVVGGLARPQGVAVNPETEELFWAEAGLSEKGEDGSIMAARIGESPRLLLGGLSEPDGITLDLANQDVYWTDRATGKIQRTGMSGALPFFQDVVTGLPSPTAITIVPEPSTSMLFGIVMLTMVRHRRIGGRRGRSLDTP